jgi:hypothetical protein
VTDLDRQQLDRLIAGLRDRGIHTTAAGTPVHDAWAQAALDALDRWEREADTERAVAAAVRQTALRGFTIGIPRPPRRWRAAAPR